MPVRYTAACTARGHSYGTLSRPCTGRNAIRLTPVLRPWILPRTAFQLRRALWPADRQTGVANGSNDAMRLLELLHEEVMEDKKRLDAAFVRLHDKPGDKVLERQVQHLQNCLASEDKRREALEAKLSGGATAAVSSAEEKAVVVVRPAEDGSGLEDLEEQELQQPMVTEISFNSDQDLQQWLAINESSGLLLLPDDGSVPKDKVEVRHMRYLEAGRRYFAFPSRGGTKKLRATVQSLNKSA